MSDPDDFDRFKACLPYTLRQECPMPDDWSNPKNFSDDRHDRGGATMCGITQREYDSFRRRKGEPVQSVKLITAAEGEEIYDTEYWLPYCPLLPVGLDLSFFDSSVNEGTHEAIKILQVALDLESDGVWGPRTEAALRLAVHSDTVRWLIQKFTKRRAAVYRLMPDDKYFDADWQRRTKEIGDASLAMLAPPQAPPADTPPAAPSRDQHYAAATAAMQSVLAAKGGLAHFLPATEIAALAKAAVDAVLGARA